MQNDINYEYINTILEEGTFSAAANKLFISQPALSQFINRIEKELGADIFIRNIKPLRLTEAGQIYFETRVSISNLKKAMKNQIFELQNLERGQITIGSSHYRSMTLLTQVLPIFKELYPKIQVNLVEKHTMELEECAMNLNTDFSIVMFPLLKENNLHCELLFEEEVLVATSPKHWLIKHMNIDFPQSSPYPQINFADLKDDNFIVLNKGQHLRRSFYQLCNICDIYPKIILETDDMPTAQSLAATGIGVTLVVDKLINYNLHSEKPIYFSTKQKIPKRQVVIAYNPARKMSKAAQIFKELLKETVRNAYEL